MAEKKGNTEDRRRVMAPDQVKITAMQAERLAAVSAVDAREIQGLTVAELSEKLRWRIDPGLFLFRRICGRVVKKDPVSGIEYPVAYATVVVEDTDCSLLGYFPSTLKWAWYFPFRCRREVIATVKTDRCGNFCVYIPYWDIDWILKWRRERICSPVIFERPTIAELLKDLIVREPGPVPPRPEPDPGPLLQIDRGQLLSTVEQQIGRGTARKLGTALSRVSFSTSAAGAIDLLQDDAFDAPLPPPLPEELRLVDSNKEGLRSTLGARLNLDAGVLKDLDPRRFVGPFRRCFDIFIPEWAPIFDVPDITFRVLQDVNGDGTEETIYSEGLFQVRWDAGALPNVKLVASPIAIAVPECGETVHIPCGNVPEIVRAGRMPVRGDLTMYDPAAGYAVRPNRPHPSGNPADGLPRPAAESPFHGTVPIYGCVDVDTPATHYRILDSYSPDGSPAPFLPVRGHSWWVTRLDAGGTVAEYFHVTPDADGWYPIVIPTGGNPNEWEPPNLLLDWDTTRAGNGKHTLRIELGTGGSPLSPQPPTDEVAFNVDNTAPHTTFAVEYRKNGTGPFLPLTFPCPVVRRGVVPQDVEFRVTFTVAADHLRDVSLSGGGCGAGQLIYTSGAPAGWFPNAAVNPTSISHWHQTVNDNSEVVTAFFRLAASALQGTYSFGAWAASRALNPAGGDTGHLVTPMYEYDPADLHVAPSFPFSVIDAD